MAQQQPIGKQPLSTNREIPDKLYFRIGEVARLCEVPAYVLRFWESEFPQLRPNKGGTGQRLYRRRDVEMALRVKSLLYDLGLTIPGARQLLKSEQRHKEPTLALGIAETPDQAETAKLRKLRRELREILTILSKPATRTSGRTEAPTPIAIRAIRPRTVAPDEPKIAPDPTRMPEGLFDQPFMFNDPLPPPDQQ
jgi:DNA-binding transcriptional MerR regulator